MKIVVLIFPIAPLTIALWFQGSLIPFIGQITDLVLLRILTALLLVIAALISYIIYIRPWLSWHEPTGTWLSLFSSIRYCAKCHADNKQVPLKNEITGWRCMVCARFYSDPIRVAQKKMEEEKTTSKRRTSKYLERI